MNCFSKPVHVPGRRIYILDLVVLPAEWEGRYVKKSLNHKSLNIWCTFCFKAAFKVFLAHRGWNKRSEGDEELESLSLKR